MTYTLRGRAAAQWLREKHVMRSILSGRFFCRTCLYSGPHADHNEAGSGVVGWHRSALPLFVCPGCFELLGLTEVLYYRLLPNRGASQTRRVGPGE